MPLWITQPDYSLELLALPRVPGLFKGAQAQAGTEGLLICRLQPVEQTTGEPWIWWATADRRILSSTCGKKLILGLHFYTGGRGVCLFIDCVTPGNSCCLYYICLYPVQSKVRVCLWASLLHPDSLVISLISSAGWGMCLVEQSEEGVVPPSIGCVVGGSRGIL